MKPDHGLHHNQIHAPYDGPFQGTQKGTQIRPHHGPILDLQMRQHHGIHHGPRMSEATDFIQLDIHRCRACWKCIEVCKEGVIGEINILVHKHAVISNPARCRGCLRCTKACKNQAITALT